ncbi:MAG: DUF4159 domain-containing protein [Bacteroidetes bacterium]|nr:DUF4159 domain-containing protein [Bacteroidota bacterium]
MAGFSQIRVGLLKYGGGGDWYANPTSLPNLVQFARDQARLNLSPRVESVDPLSPTLYTFQVLHTTGHGNISFSDTEREALRRYLLNGGFLHVDDNYGMAPYFRKEISKLFPDRELVPVPASYGLFSAWFAFPSGLPKIHEHDGKAPEAWGIFEGNRLVLLFTTECDLGDGWEDPEVHQNPPDKRLAALRMGTNILVWALSQ